MKSFLWKWLPICFGCHQKKSRTIFIQGQPLPLCARCTGELAGILIALISFWWAAPSALWCLPLLLPLLVDGFYQQLTSYESTNGRRLITGILFGYGLCCLFLHSSCWMVRQGISFGLSFS